GPQFTNQLIHCDAGPRTVRAYPVEKSGAGYKATMVDILTSTDNWYRPSDVAIAPDGSLVVADWYDPGVGGHAMGDHEAGKIMGRIYRVAATGASAKPATPDFSTADGAVKALQSPNRATVYAAWQTLHALGAKAEPALTTLWKSNDPRQRARGLGLLARIPGRQAAHLRDGLLDADSDVRVAAVRLCSTLERSGILDTTPLEEDRALVGQLLRDSSPQVRRQIALSLYRTKEIAPLWAALAAQHDGSDRWYLEALGIGAIGNEDACFDAWLAMVGDKWNTPGGRDIIWRMRTAKAAGYLAKIIADEKIPALEKPRFLREFDFLPASAEKTRALAELASLGNADGIVREALTRLKPSDLQTDPALAAVLKKTLDRAKGTPQLIDLVSDLKVAGQGAALLDAALKNPQDARAAVAFKLVLNDPQFPALFDAALAGPQAETFVALLGTSSEVRVINSLAKISTNLTNPLPRRTAAIQALARTQTGAQTLVQLAKNNELPADLKPAATTALNLVQYPTLKADIATLFPAPATLGGQPLAPIAELVKMKGDLAKGRAIFERAESSCITCHRVNDKGVDFAPALSEIGTKLPKEAIYDAIINPNTSLSMGFETTQVSMKDGTLGMGIVRSETQDELVLALPGGVTTQFRKSEITKREKLTTSMMPSGLNQALTQGDLVNLVEYLASLKKK
ncbi:MAG: c-type cytochrome, partial [Chthoniobacteraceae bacterium]